MSTLPWSKGQKINLYFAYFAWLKQVKLSPYFALFIVGKISLHFALLCPSNDKENAKTNSTDLSLLCLLCPYFAYFVPTLPTMHFTHTLFFVWILIYLYFHSPMISRFNKVRDLRQAEQLLFHITQPTMALWICSICIFWNCSPAISYLF